MLPHPLQSEPERLAKPGACVPADGGHPMGPERSTLPATAPQGRSASQSEESFMLHHRLLLVTAALSGLCSWFGTANAADSNHSKYRFVNKLVDISDVGHSYGYAPTIVYENGTFHMFYCSTGTNLLDWDNISTSLRAMHVGGRRPR
jgi:hypothetical protein